MGILGTAQRLRCIKKQQRSHVRNQCTVRYLQSDVTGYNFVLALSNKFHMYILQRTVEYSAVQKW